MLLAMPQRPAAHAETEPEAGGGECQNGDLNQPKMLV